MDRRPLDSHVTCRARVVIIKGTSLYNAEKGQFVELGKFFVALFRLDIDGYGRLVSCNHRRTGCGTAAALRRHARRDANLRSCRSSAVRQGKATVVPLASIDVLLFRRRFEQFPYLPSPSRCVCRAAKASSSPSTRTSIATSRSSATNS